MQRSYALFFTALALLLGASCGNGASPRGDIILIIAERAPTDPSPAFEHLMTRSIAFAGVLEFPQELAHSNEAILEELLSGTREGQVEGTTYEWLLNLPQSAQLSGYRSLGVTNHMDAFEGFGMEEHFDYGLFPIEEGENAAGEEPQPHGVRAAISALTSDYEQKGIRRAPVLIVADLLGTEGQLESTLEEIRIGLLEEGEQPRADPLFCILFTAPDSAVRAIISGSGLSPETIRKPVAPRDFFPTIGRRADLKITAYLEGVVVPGFLSGRDLLRQE